MKSSTDAPAGEMKRIGVLVGDRLCATCGFNLVGQTIVREPHYGMLMVRCPECGTAAATQEYPVLGRWAGRWAMVLAAAWLIVLLIAVGLSSLFLFLPSIGVVEDGSRTLAESIAAEYDTWQAAQPPKPVTPRVRAGKVKTVVANGPVITVRPATPADVALATPAAPAGAAPTAGAGSTDGSADAEEADEAGAPTSTAEDPAADPAVTASGVQTIAPVIVPPTPPPPVAVQRADIYQSLDRQWVDTADFGAILAKHGGVFASVDAIGYRWLAIEAIVAAVLGVVWSVLLFGARRARLPLVIPIILALSSE